MYTKKCAMQIAYFVKSYRGIEVSEKICSGNNP